MIVIGGVGPACNCPKCRAARDELTGEAYKKMLGWLGFAVVVGAILLATFGVS